MDSVTHEVYERIAKMENIGVKPSEIAVATGLTESRISQIRTDVIYKEILAGLSVSELESFQTLNQGWDQIEALSVNNILVELANNPDVDTSLKAASLANKATRRGRQNVPLGGQGGGRAVLHMNNTFINKLNAIPTTIIDRREQMKSLEQKDSSFLPPSSVEELLKPVHVIEEEPDDIIGSLIQGAFATA